MHVRLDISNIRGKGFQMTKQSAVQYFTVNLLIFMAINDYYELSGSIKM